MSYNKFKKVICLLFALIAMLSAPLAIGADAKKSLNDLKDEYNDLQEEIEDDKDKLEEVQGDIKSNEEKLVSINGEIDVIKGEIAELDEKIGVLDGEIGKITPDIERLEGEIAKIEAHIADLEDQITELNGVIADTQDQALERIREDYINGGNESLIEILFTSEDLTSFLSRLELVERTTEKDEKLMDDLGEQAKAIKSLQNEAQQQKKAVEADKAVLDAQVAALEEKQGALEDARSEAQDKEDQLNAKHADIADLLNELDEDSEAYQKQIARNRADMQILADKIDNYIEENSSSTGGKKGTYTQDVPKKYSSTGELMWPVPYENTYVSCPYGHYSDGSPHWGMDICVRGADGSNASNGKDIVAADSGTVILAVNNGAYNYGYGNYCIIDHGNGINTLYCHTRQVVVYEGQYVSKGQKIAEIGLTGNTTGYHLHFEVRLKNSDGSVSRVNPANYVSRP